MKRTIIIISITIILLIFAIYELIQVNFITHYLENKVSNLDQKYEENAENISVLSGEIAEISDYWNSYEDALCLIFSHKDLSTTTDSLTRLLAYTKNNDYDNAIVEITLLQELASKNYHIMGFNIHNVL